MERPFIVQVGKSLTAREAALAAVLEMQKKALSQLLRLDARDNP